MLAMPKAEAELVADSWAMGYVNASCYWGARYTVLGWFRRHWLEARTRVLLGMWEDLDSRLLLILADEQHALEVATAVEHTFDILGRHYRFNELSNSDKKVIAAELRRQAKTRSILDPNGAHGFGLVCLWLESQTLGNDEARLVCREVEERISELDDCLKRHKDAMRSRTQSAEEKPAALLQDKGDQLSLFD
jgi:hypothetical protein